MILGSMTRLALCIYAGLTACAMVLSGCTYNTTPATACPTDLSFPVALVYPTNGAANVSPSITSVVLQGGFKNYPVSVAVVSLESGLLTQSAIGAAPVPLPSPLARPANVAGYPLGSVALPPLTMLTNYGVTVIQNFPGNLNCPAVNVDLGSFTTGY